jgi:hypothetical protein
MAADLVTTEEVKGWLGIPREDASQDVLLRDLASRVEDLLEQSKNRTFKLAGSTPSVVTVDGTGSWTIWLDRPIASLTSVKMGLDVTAPDETLLPGPKVLLARGRELSRQDGMVFPRGRANIHVEYTAASSVSEAAKQAVLDAVALLYRQRGSEDATSENVGSFAHGLRDSFESLPSWQAVPSRPVLV